MKDAPGTGGAVDPVVPPPGGTNRLLAGAIAVLGVAIAGAAAVAVLTLSADDRGSPPVTVSKTVTQDAARSPTPPKAEAAEAKRDIGVSNDATARIQALIADYYSAVQARRFIHAWGLLSSTYRSWKAGNGGFALWRRQEGRNADRLHFSGLRVTVRDPDPAGDVATIHVSGMRYTEPDGSICRYEGVTWARRNGGKWRYDQGYLQDPARSAEWRPRRTETLGYACDESGY